MARDNLLRDAIADAKAVRDTAIVNAKLSLEEAFKPHLSSIISARLRNEAEGYGSDDDEMMKEDNDATSGIGATAVTVKNPGPKMPSAATRDSSHIENPGQEVEEFDSPKGAPKTVNEAEFGVDVNHDGEDDVDFDFDGGGDVAVSAAPQAPAGMGLDAPGGDLGMGAPDMGMGGDEFGGEGDVTDLDLDAIIRELELDVTPEGQPHSDMSMEAFSDPMAGAKVRGPMDGALKETLAGQSGWGECKDGVSPTAVDGVNGGKKVSPGQEVTASKADRMSEEINLDEILREIEEEASKDSTSSVVTENVRLKEENRKCRDVIQYMRGTLQEVNMLNAKLMFTNKLFKKFDLNAGQKMKIVETFDRATTPREVKLVFSTLAESFAGKTATTSKKKINSAKVVTEGFASKSVGSTKPKSAPVIAEGNDLRERFMRLANIKPIN